MGGLCSVGGQGDACALASARLRSETASDKMMVPVLFHRVLRRRRKEPAHPGEHRTAIVFAGRYLLSRKRSAVVSGRFSNDSQCQDFQKERLRK